MRKITKDNYEEFFLDFLEGDLSEHDFTALEEFLLINPELKEELEQMELLNLEPQKECFVEKSNLKKSAYEADFDSYCIARIEGDLHSEELQEFETFIESRKELLDSAVLYEKTLLEADKRVVCPDKDGLYKKVSAGYFHIVWPYLVAASVAVLFFLWLPDQHETNNNLASIVKPIDAPRSISEEKVKVVDTKNEKVQKLLKRDTEIIYAEPSGQKSSVLPINSSSKKEITPLSRKRVLIATLEAPSIVVAPVAVNNQINREMMAMNKIDLYLSSNTYSQDYSANESAVDESGLVWKESSIVDKKGKEKRGSLINIAGKGIQKLGQLAGKNLNMEKRYDPESDRVRFAFNSSAIGFSTNRKKLK